MSTRRLLHQNNADGPIVPFRLATAGNTAPLGAATFTRADAATCATQTTSTPVLQSVAANILRDAHYAPSSVAGQKVRTILLEGSQRNRLTYANTMDAAPWAVLATASRTQAQGTGPDGANSAVGLSGIVDDGLGTSAMVGMTDGGIYTVSVHAKGDTQTSFKIQEAQYVGDNKVFNLAAGTCTAGATIVPAGDNWYRCLWSRQYSAGQTLANFAFYLRGTGRVLLYGADIIDSGVQTSHIDTVASSLTRAVDALSLAGSSLVGTLFYHYYDLATQAWADAVAVYAGNVAIVPPVDRAYSHIAVVQGTRTAAQCKAIIGGMFP